MTNLSRYNFYLQCIADVIALLLAYTFAFWWKFLSSFRTGVYTEGAYLTLIPAMLVSYFVAAYFFSTRDNFVTRKFGRDLKEMAKIVAVVVVITLLYMFFAQTGLLYSREFVVVFAIAFFVLGLGLREIFRRIVRKFSSFSKNVERCVLICRYADVRKKIREISSPTEWRINLAGLVVTDRDMTGEYIEGIKVLADTETMVDVIRQSPVDSVLIVPNGTNRALREAARHFNDIGKLVRVDVDPFNVIPEARQDLDRVGSCSVLSFFPVHQIARRKLFLKRVLDLVISVLLLPLLLLFIILTAVFNNLESKGPLFIRRIRVGKNGRRFTQYRFRILRMDAAERTAQGKPARTRWGVFLCVSHLDRLPLILNVLLSDMSLVGIHAPRLSRFLEYQPERRKNMCIRPGIIGRWSFELDEEEIIAQERIYIEQWNVFQELALIAEFFFRFITNTLMRGFDPAQIEEEQEIIRDILEFEKPLEYDHSAYQHTVTGRERLYLAAKRVTDIIVSGLAIAVLSPLFLILMILVAMDDGGSPFYAHVRIGKNGRKLRVYKFRSMKQDAGDLEKLLTPEQMEQYQREFKIDNDPRITKIGNFLRKSSLDELPQLFNIFGGGLSVVGPRPIVEKETAIYGKDVAKLLSVKPGLTGYWQAYARNNATYESGERQKMEMYYVDHHCAKLDIRIVFRTVKSVAKGDGAQ